MGNKYLSHLRLDRSFLNLHRFVKGLSDSDRCLKCNKYNIDDNAQIVLNFERYISHRNIHFLSETEVKKNFAYRRWFGPKGRDLEAVGSFPEVCCLPSSFLRPLSSVLSPPSSVLRWWGVAGGVHYLTLVLCAPSSVLCLPSSILCPPSIVLLPPASFFVLRPPSSVLSPQSS